jgi:3-deoxy-D-manno-octulosonic-acid transferase
MRNSSKPGPIYAFIVHTYFLAVRLAAVFGHRRAKELLQQGAKDIDRPDGPLIWIHAASAGEGNQAEPLARELAGIYGARILISFFSPSGLVFHRDNPAFDRVVLLPPDMGTDASRFVAAVDPLLAVFIRNELWQGYINALAERRVPAFLVNAPQHILVPRGLKKEYVLRNLGKFNAVFASRSVDRHLASHRYKLAAVSGDTKWEAAMAAEAGDAVLADFSREGPIVILGSSWAVEEEFLLKWLERQKGPQPRILIAPHDASPARIAEIRAGFAESCLYSSYSEKDAGAKVMILDSYGILRTAYRYADVAVIGGGFGKGIHNVVEAAVHGIPVIFGPNHRKFAEAGQLAGAGLALPVRNYEEFEAAMNGIIHDEEARDRIRAACTAFIASREKISKAIAEEIATMIPPSTSGL